MHDPSAFFAAKRQDLDLSHALVFGIVCHWLSQISIFFWSKIAPSQDAESMSWIVSGVGETGGFGLPIERWMQIWEFFISPSRVLLDPFFVLSALSFSAFGVWIGSQMVLRRLTRRPTFREVLALLAYAQGPFLLLVLAGVVPLASFVATAYCVVIGVVGIREYFMVSTGRAIVVYFFPALFAWIAFLLFVGILLVLALPFLW